ncbi:MAG: hypothetical protein GXX99_06890, partial [Clostridiales bacterium]|nr:hypothetical protein [Clostridiales bacterium]
PYAYLKVVLVFFGIILLVWLSVVCRWPGAVQPGGVVLCILLFNTPENHVAYTLGRILDTGIGVVFAIAVNEVFKRDRVDRWLAWLKRQWLKGAPLAEAGEEALEEAGCVGAEDGS